MFGNPSDEPDRSSHGSAKVSDCHGTLHWPVRSVLRVSDRSGRGRGRGPARHLVTLRPLLLFELTGQLVSAIVQQWPATMKQMEPHHTSPQQATSHMNIMLGLFNLGGGEIILILAIIL